MALGHTTESLELVKCCDFVGPPGSGAPLAQPFQVEVDAQVSAVYALPVSVWSAQANNDAISRCCMSKGERLVCGTASLFDKLPAALRALLQFTSMRLTLLAAINLNMLRQTALYECDCSGRRQHITPHHGQQILQKPCTDKLGREL